LGIYTSESNGSPNYSCCYFADRPYNAHHVLLNLTYAQKVS
jgi:hypothetical protein